MKKSMIEGSLNEEDKAFLDKLQKYYDKNMQSSIDIENSKTKEKCLEAKESLHDISRKIGDELEAYITHIPNIHVYSYETPSSSHAQASRIISKLRDINTKHEEFVYYIQRAYELMFAHIYCQNRKEKRAMIVKTPVDYPSVQYACHRIVDIDDLINNSAMCVMLRGALLPSMIVSKEIEEYSSSAYITPFCLFRIKRNEEKIGDLEYIIDLDRSFFNKENLDGKDLIFADPMNATGGSLITILTFLKNNNIKPKSVKFINIISALRGCLNIIRTLKDIPIDIYTLWLDPVLNEKSYILPGLGDAGDRLNGTDTLQGQRNIIQLIADYGQRMSNLYRSQVREIENTVFLQR